MGSNISLIFKVFMSGFALQTLNMILDKPKTLLQGMHPWIQHLKRGGVRGGSYVAMLLMYRLMQQRAASVPENIRRFLVSLIGGYHTHTFLSSYLLMSSVISKYGQGLSTMAQWRIFAALMNYQLWAQAHHMPKSWTSFIGPAVGTDFKCINYRASTRIIVPCDDPVHGIHPNRTCAQGAVDALVKGVPNLAYTVFVVYVLRAATGKVKLGRDFIFGILRTIFSVTLQMHSGRFAFCIQSRCFKEFQWWIGPLWGAICSNFALLDAESLRAHVNSYTLANVFSTWLTTVGLDSKAIYAGIFATGAIMDDRGRLNSLFSN